MKNFIYTILGFGLIILLSCKKNITELPPETQTGANTFGAKVDGKLWGPAGMAVVATAPTLEARYANGNVFINARNYSSSPTETEFEIYIANINGPGVYSLNTDTPKYPNQTGSYGFYIKRTFMPENEWITSSQHGGAVTITKIDTANRIVSGTFQFDALNITGAPVIIHVTEGRFDVKLTN
jgi:hypothetical protein